MAVTAHVYPNYMLKLVTGTRPTASPSLVTNTFAAGLCTAASAPTWGATQWAYVFASDITGAYTEVTTGGGYTSGWSNRQALTTFTFALGSANNIYNWNCTAPAPISFGASTTITARTMFIYDKTSPTNPNTTDGNSWCPWSTDFGASVVSTAGAFTYTQDAVNGLAYWTMS
jgi:hypothetical protein